MKTLNAKTQTLLELLGHNEAPFGVTIRMKSPTATARNPGSFSAVTVKRQVK